MARSRRRCARCGTVDNFNGTYATFHRAIQRRMPSVQSPNFFRTGVSDYRYEQQQPSSI